jgi:hypothetical protein
VSVEQGQFMTVETLRRRTRKPRQHPEDVFQLWVMDSAQAAGWLVFIIPDWLYRLAMAALKQQRRSDRRWGNKGWLDMILLRPGQFKVRELKVRGGRLSVEQREVLRMLKGAGIDAGVWWNDQKTAILGELQ